jgi:hypothetical protein
MCVGVTLVNATIAAAQVPTIPVGTRVRVNAAWPNTDVVGRVESQRADTIAVETYAGTRFVPLVAVKRIDVSVGRSHSDGTVRGMKIGAIGVGGTVAFFLVALHFVSDGDNCGGDECTDALALAPVLIPTGVVVGGVVGGVIGLLAGSEQWDGLYFAPPRVSMLPQRGGATRIGLSLHF